MVKKADLTDHLQKECVFRLETCGFCKRQIPLNRMKVPSSNLLSSHSSYDSICFFTITAEILARSLANFYRQYADRHMNLKFVRRVSERERAIRPFVIVKKQIDVSF